eukprot:m.35815 g.35815  ORF g.35815 m.35815 type:complete len:245 (-) comp9925_c0_seq2:125-859(-)
MARSSNAYLPIIGLIIVVGSVLLWLREDDAYGTGLAVEQTDSSDTQALLDDMKALSDSMIHLQADAAALIKQRDELIKMQGGTFSDGDQKAHPISDGKPRYREDGRCGPNFPAPGAFDFGECDPNADLDRKGPCCNPESGYCGNVRGVKWGHCDCPTCVDYSQKRAKKLAPLGKDQNGEKPKFRADGRCGPNFPAPGSEFGQCNPKGDADGVGPCCNPTSGYCGNIRHVSWGHCDCPDCVDYSV